MATNTKFQCAYRAVPRVQVDFSNSELLTEQKHKQECDISTILNRFSKTGVLEHRNTHRGSYGFASSQTFQDAMQIVAKGTQMFEELPSEIRDRFNHEPAKFLAFVQDEKNASQLVEMGLAKTLDDIPSKTPQISRDEIITALQGVNTPASSNGSSEPLQSASADK